MWAIVLKRVLISRRPVPLKQGRHQEAANETAMVQNDSTPFGATIALAGSPPRLLRPLLPKESFSNTF
jgi:hypothetical protein